ncbi:Uncharacterised protein [Mycobacteroides abscessus subsp. abscessus]|nr:Uncharacterised protein [Mycobacteroides abscessus subsp. abscessus]
MSECHNTFRAMNQRQRGQDTDQQQKGGYEKPTARY